jgi:hypothetical protein
MILLFFFLFSGLGDGLGVGDTICYMKQGLINGCREGMLMES